MKNLVLTLTLLFIFQFGNTAEPKLLASTTLPFTEVANPDGTFDIYTTSQNSIDCSGTDLHSSQEEKCIQPSFYPADLATGSLPLGRFNGPIVKMVFDGKGNLYVGGEFTEVNGVKATNIARWNGQSWSALGKGLDGSCNALAVDRKGHLYAGGTFRRAGDRSAIKIARWDGSNWFALGKGLEGPQGQEKACYAICFDAAGNLYAGGLFERAGEVAANSVAKWDGSKWSNLGEGLIDGESRGLCHALTFKSDSILIAGGFFNKAGQIEAANIARWNGSEWSTIANGAIKGGGCHTLASLNNGDLFVGGDFNEVIQVTGEDQSDTTRFKTNGFAIWKRGLWKRSEIKALSDSTDAIFSSFIFDHNGNLYANELYKEKEDYKERIVMLSGKTLYFKLDILKSLFLGPLAIDQYDRVYYRTALESGASGIVELRVLQAHFPQFKSGRQITVSFNGSEITGADQDLEFLITDGQQTISRYGKFAVLFTYIKNQLAQNLYELRSQEIIGNQHLYYFSQK